MKALIILVHPDIQNSFINKSVVEKLKEQHGDNIEIHDLYKEFPDFKIAIRKEQDLVDQFDKVIFQFPVYWYSSPALLKEWFDKVFTTDWAYENGNMLKDKKIGLAISFGAVKSEFIEFNNSDSANLSIQNIIYPFLTSFNYVKANFIGTECIFDSLSATDNDINEFVLRYSNLIEK